MSLSSLLSQFRQLQIAKNDVRSKAQRGLAFEHLLSDLFRLQGLLTTEPFRISGEQVDGAFEQKGWTYLVEIKWSDKKSSTDALYAFQGKPDRRIEGTRGLFISMSGYHLPSLERFAQGRKPNTILWTSEHIEAVLEGRITIPELLDLSVRYAAERSDLLLPLDLTLSDRTKSLFQIALEASRAQVEEEISMTVGRKYIPKLYIQRSVESEISRLLHPERELNELLEELVKGGIPLPKQITDSQGRNISDPESLLRSVLDSARTHKLALGTAHPIRQVVDDMPNNPMGRMHVLMGRAGMGKTNLLCHLSKNYSQEQPTVFLTGRSGITSTTSIRDLIESKLVRHLRDPFPRDRCFDHLVSVARAKATSLLVIIDAINEHKDFDIMNGAISQFLREVTDKPVVILASCRDVYWPFFDASTWPAPQWKLLNRRLGEFSALESERAIEAYFDFYNIRASLTSRAKEKLADPLVLRFYCETYGDPTQSQISELNEVVDIRLKVLFDEYLARKLESICHTSPRRFRTPHTVERFLFRLADRMRTTKSRNVQRDLLPTITAEQNLDSPESTYVSILGEDILLEEEPDQTTGAIQVVFTYDEFMEYMIARSMLRVSANWDRISAEELVRECETSIDVFPSLVGVLEYLAVILREEYDCLVWDAVTTTDHRFAAAICSALGKLGAEFVGERELSTIASLVKSTSWRVRLCGVHRLNAIACGQAHRPSSRVKAEELLVEVLASEDDISIRLEAMEYFRLHVPISEVGHRVMIWWRERLEFLSKMPIVVCEDERHIREIYEGILEDSICERVYGAEDGESGIKLVNEIMPALIITDMNKPGISGEEMTRRLKVSPATSAIPVLLITGTQTGLEELMEAGLFCGILRKPFDLRGLESAVEMSFAGKFR